MDRRTFLALLGLPAVVALLEACAGDDEAEAAATGTARSALGRTTAPADASPAAVEAINALGIDLYRAVAHADMTGNLVLSPASVAVALTMTAAGARGKTLDEMVATLHLEDATTIHRSMNALTAQLAALEVVDTRLSMTNSLWGQSGVTFDTTFLDLLAAEYGSGMETVDYAHDAEAARLAINQWVSDATQQRIIELLAEGTTTNDTRLTLVNAVYLLARWAIPFDEGATSDAPFTTADGDEVSVPAMRQTIQLDYAAGDGWRAVELPYARSSLAMLIFVPEDGFLETFEQIFLVTDATRYLAPHRVALQLPRFDIGSAFGLADALKGLGMRRAFSDDADFSGMTTEVDLQIAAVVHQANITVTEWGTEAAAATAVDMATSAAPQDDPIELVIDRPFVFALRDRATGTLLFLGRVADPRS